MATPNWVEEGGWTTGWEKPWTVPRDPGQWFKFKAALRRRGLLSPHFTIVEFASKPGCACNSGPPSVHVQIHLQQPLAFALEDARHDLGAAIGSLSGYRNPCKNDCVDGATYSRHMVGDAIDPLKPASVSWDRFNAVMRRVFEHGGIGSGSVSGHVQHVDLGDRRRWTYAGR